MQKAVRPIPEGFHTLTPYIVVKGGKSAIEFYEKAFGAKVVMRHDMPDGKVMHAQLKIGDSMLMLSDEFDMEGGCGMKAPQRGVGASMMIHMYVTDADSSFDRAVKAGAKVKEPLENTFWGDRYGLLEDPFGHLWSVSMQVEELTQEEIAERAYQLFGPK